MNCIIEDPVAQEYTYLATAWRQQILVSAAKTMLF
jgi:hypothetical protein